MKNTIAIMISLLFSACTTNTTNTDITKDSAGFVDTTTNTLNNIPFEEAKNYFVKNTFTADSLADPKIVTQKDFDAIFGMASTMSAGGKPTPIDFSKQYVIAIIRPVTDKATTLAVQSLLQKENDIILSYTKTEREKQSFNTRPFLLLIVDNTYNKNIVIKKQ
jgi:hypothetical protein